MTQEDYEKAKRHLAVLQQINFEISKLIPRQKYVDSETEQINSLIIVLTYKLEKMMRPDEGIEQ